MNENTGIGAPTFEVPDFCRAMLEASLMPMVLLSGDRHLILCVNGAFKRLVGAVDGELIGEPFSKAVPESDAPLILLDRVLRSGKPETHIEGSSSHRFYRSYAIWPVASLNGSRVGIILEVTQSAPIDRPIVAMNEALLIGSVRQHELAEAAGILNGQLQEEIIWHKQAQGEMERQQGVMERQQRELRASELRLRGVIEAIPQIVWTATPDGTLDFANSKWFECFGVDLDTFNRSGWSMLLHEDDKDRTLEAWTNGLGAGSAFQLEHRLRSFGSHSRRWYFSRAVPIRDAGGKVEKWFGTSTDIDERKRAEIAGFAAQKLESLGVLAGGIAHDFNNLLCVILGSASLMEEGLLKSHPLQANIAEIAIASESAAHLTRQMLAYAGKGRFLIEPTDINEVVRSTCQLCKASLPGKVSLTVETRPDLPLVQADAGQMQQVVMNLVQNAAEALDESAGGRVSVSTELVEMTADAIAKSDPVTGSPEPGSFVAIEIKDNGSGMDEATKAKILEPFFTTKFTGRGLGLAAVAGILRGQGGFLEVRTTVGKGSTFRAYLPAAAAAARERDISPAPRKIRGEGTILVIDDEKMVRRVAGASLENGGFTVLLANGGAEALVLLQGEAASSIALILLDLSMPDMSGREVMEEIRRLGIDIPILICSGYSETEVNREFSGLEIAGFIQKPFSIKRLANRVHEALDRKQPRKTQSDA